MRGPVKRKVSKRARNSEQVKIDPKFAPVVKAFAKVPDVSAGKLFSSYGLKVKGKIFAMFGKEQFVVKLPKERVDGLVAGGNAERFDPGHGRVMKEWVVIQSGESEWVELAREAYNFVKQGKH